MGWLMSRIESGGNMTTMTRRAYLQGLLGVAASSCFSPEAVFGQEAPIPAQGVGRRIRHLSYSDLGGRPDSVQVMVNRRHVYVGHMFSNGVTILDAADPRRLKPVGFFAGGDSTRTHHLQVADDLLLLANGANIVAMQSYDNMRGYFENALADSITNRKKFRSGLSIHDISRPAEMREIAFLEMPGLGINRRDHRRQLIIDGRIAFTGGVNISDTYSSAPSGRLARTNRDLPANPAEGWRDTHVQIEGPVVAEFQKLFMDTWARQKGEPLAERNYFPELTAQGDEIVRAIGSTPDNPQSEIYLTLISAITHAESTIHLTIAYFAPDPQLLTALTDAARRGVDVKLVLPSFSDSGAVFHLGRSFYTELLRGGVKIYELRGAMMHAKTAIIDGVWSTIGSTNLDWRSFLHNDEINAVILGRGFATQMETMFADDVRESDAIELAQWKRRSLLFRMKERMARVGAYWL